MVDSLCLFFLKKRRKKMKLWIMDRIRTTLRGSYEILGVYNDETRLKSDLRPGAEYHLYEDDDGNNEFDFKEGEQLFARLKLDAWNIGSYCWFIEEISNNSSQLKKGKQFNIRLNCIDRRYEELPT